MSPASPSDLPAVLRGVLEDMPESVAIYAPDSTVVYVNPATERIFGKTLAEMRGQRLFDLFPDAVGNPFHQAFERVARGGPPEVFDHYYPPFDRWFANRITRVDGLVHVVAREVTEEVRRRRRLEATARISELLTREEVDEPRGLRAIAEALVPILDADCSVALLTPDRASLEIVAWASRREDAAEAAALPRLPADRGHPAEALRTRRPVLADRDAIEAETRRVEDPAVRASVERYAPGSLVVAPLVVGGDPIGVLFASRRRDERSLHGDDRTIVGEVAAGIALHVAHARRRAEAIRLRQHLAADQRAATERLTSLLSVTGLLARADTADEIARIVVDEGLRALDATLAGLWSVSPEGDALVLRRAHGYRPEHLEAFRRVPLGDRAPLGDAVATGRPVYVENRAEYASRYPDLERLHRPNPAPPLAFAVLPLLVEGRAIGALNFSFHDERRLSLDERTYLEVLASHAAEALRRARLYAELRDASETREAMISASPAAIMLVDEQGLVRSWNPAAERIFGWSAAEVIGGPLPSLPPECRQEFVANLRHVLAGHVLVGREARRWRKDGQWIDVELYAAPVRLSDGRTLCLTMIVDVSDRKRQERGRALVAAASGTLARSLDLEHTLGEFVARVIDGFADVCTVDLSGPDGVLRRVAAAPADAPAIGTVRPALRRGLRDERHGLRSVLSVPLLAGERVLGALALGSRARDFDEVDLAIAQEVASHVASAAENGRLYAEARAARAEAEAANRTKDQFLAMLGHELRNPLAPIGTALQLMRLRAPEALVREREVLERQVAHLTRLVDDLLDVSRITRGKIELRREHVPVAAVVARAIEQTSPLLEQREHHLSVEVPPDLVVHADPTRLAQVVANLLSNAAKYTNSGGHVTVRAERRGDEVRIAVGDDGVGIPPEMLPTIFDLFVQAPQGAARTGGGLGLGLAIVRGLVQQHGGAVQATSAGPGRGTEVVVTLPIGAPPASSAAAPAQAGRDRAAAARRVLVVDDNVDAATLLAELLAASGHEVATAYDGPSALRIAETFRPQVAVLDIGLPVMDGYEVAQRLRERGPLRLIAVTGYGQDADRARARAAGFDAHLAKPVEPDVLLAHVERGQSVPVR